MMATHHHLLFSLILILCSLYYRESMNILKMASKQKLNVQSFPRPPLLEKTPRHLQIKWNGELIADTKDAYWVLETHHPPSKYMPVVVSRHGITDMRQLTISHPRQSKWHSAKRLARPGASGKAQPRIGPLPTPATLPRKWRTVSGHTRSPR